MSKLALKTKDKTKTPPAAPPNATGGLPTVNLLPPSIIEGVQQKRLIRKFILGAVGVLVVTGLAWGAQTAQIIGANNNLEEQQANTAVLAAEQNKYAPVADYYLAVNAQRTTVGAQMSSSVENSQIAQKLLLLAPPASGVKLGSLSIATGAATCPGPDPFAVSKVPAAGCVSLVGTAANVQQVGTLLNALRDEPGFSNAFVTSASAGDGGVAFNGTVNVTSDFYTKRYAKLLVTEPVK